MLTFSENDINWIAGFLEGEGFFGKCGRTVVVNAVQVQKWPIEKLEQLCGGNIETFSRKEVTGNIYHRWSIYGPRAIEVMLNVYHLISPRRKQQINNALSFWATTRGNNRAGRGYTIDERDNIKNRVSVFLTEIEGGIE